MNYRSKFRASRYTKKLKNSIISLLKGDVTTYILNDVRNRLDKEEIDITITMLKTPLISKKSVVDYLNNYHDGKINAWKLDFAQTAFYMVYSNLYSKLAFYSDIEVNILDFSETDKRIKIKLKPKGD